MIGYWIVMAVAALAVVAVLIAVLTAEDLPGTGGDTPADAIAAFGVARLPDGGDWVASLRLTAGNTSVVDHTEADVAASDLSRLFDAIRPTDRRAAAVVALPEREPDNDREREASERALCAMLAAFRHDRPGIVVLLPAHQGTAPHSGRWRATVARLTTEGGALLLTTGEVASTLSEADAVASAALAWLGGGSDIPPSDGA